MKAVLISIQPKWCELIASGKKTIEVRKTRPQIETPFKCYIYATKSTFDITLCPDLNAESIKVVDKGRGKVIGEFVCDRIYTRPANTLYLPNAQNDYLEMLELACLTEPEARAYMGGQYNKDMYFWHISDLVIYDKPKELGEFLTPSGAGGVWGNHYLRRPPQSWCYVENLG